MPAPKIVDNPMFANANPAAPLLPPSHLPPVSSDGMKQAYEQAPRAKDTPKPPAAKPQIPPCNIASGNLHPPSDPRCDVNRIFTEDDYTEPAAKSILEKMKYLDEKTGKMVLPEYLRSRKPQANADSQRNQSESQGQGGATDNRHKK